MFILMMLLSVLILFQNCGGFKLDTQASLYERKHVNIKIEQYCPIGDFTLQEVFAVNMSANRQAADFVIDSDRDGLSDDFENTPAHINDYNISSAVADTNGDEYSDGVTIAVGYVTAQQVNLRACLTGQNDIDYDGLNDCEENVLRTVRNNPDTDGDGIPDGLEIRTGLNPLDPNDSSLDFDNDLRSALVEVKANTPMYLTDTVDIQDQAYRYSVAHYNVQNGNTTDLCHDILISNVPVMETANGNVVRVYIMEHEYTTTNGDSSRLKVFEVGLPSSALDNIEIQLPSVNNAQNQFQSFIVDNEGNIQ